MTAVELYKSNHDFKAFIDIWAVERRCPFPLQDLLLEEGMEDQADCAKWCSEQPDKPIFFPSEGEDKTACGPFPTKGAKSWFWSPFPDTIGYASFVDYKHCRLNDLIEGITVPSAIVNFLDNWQKESK